MKFKTLFFPIAAISAFLMFIWLTGCGESSQKTKETEFAGSESCITCHQKFYSLWAPSHHGTAMQDITQEFITKHLTFDNKEIKVQGKFYTTVNKNDSLYLIQRDKDNNISEYTALHALGGKYVFYFLIPLEKGRLQVMPIAYDVKDGEWYNNPESGVRHFVEADDLEDGELDWKNHLYTFNTSCHSCHVSQSETNYNIDDDSYHTIWKEAGINCEACHGPSQEHVRVCVEAGEGNIPEDLKILVTSTFTQEEHISSCAPCHAKMRAVTGSYPPPEPFEDHYELITLENPDYYPDGRDLGENYTMNSWSMNKCAMSSDLHCVTCHTSSGRDRFAGELANNACVSCHKSKVDNIEAHTHHKADGDAGKCIACHMPKTTFARMDRSDHSFRPPMPSATIEFGSPNSCNICHDDKTPQWADKHVREWHKDDYQKDHVYISTLIRDARAHDFTRLDEMNAALDNNKLDKVFATSLIRLYEHCESDKKWPSVIKQLNSEEALVRSAAARLLSFNVTDETKTALLKLANDKYRIVRLSVAYSLNFFPDNMFTQTELQIRESALKEYQASLVTRTDDWGAHYNLGNFHTNRGNYAEAVKSFDKSFRLNDEAIVPLINGGYAHSIMGNNKEAVDRLEKALEIDPDNEAANLNYGLICGEIGKIADAKKAFGKVLEINPKSYVAAYNLAVLVSQDDVKKSVTLSKIASDNSEDPKYQYTYGFYLYQAGEHKKAISVLTDMTKKYPNNLDAYILISNIHKGNNELDKAKSLINKAIESDKLGDNEKMQLMNFLRTLK